MIQGTTPASELNAQPDQWWVQRWLELLDSYRFKKRLERARIYAKEGNVLSIDFKDSQVLARVQGTEAEPYKISLSLDLFGDEDWNYIVETLAEKAIFSAQLLAGEMPEDIEGVFVTNGLSLFPFSLADIHSRCSCPDKVNPCKHVGAVYYQLADRFREDPFVIFQLRGRTKSQILEALRQWRRQELGEATAEPVMLVTAAAGDRDADLSQINPELPLNLANFWQYDEPLEASLVAVAPPVAEKTVLDLLGTLPLSYEEATAVRQYLQQVYQIARDRASRQSLDTI
jgi:uncharacterized Zn finger protein